MVDANQAWTASAAREFSLGVEDLNITWFEEPCDPDDVLAHQWLAENTRIPLALGEVVYSRSQFREFIRSGAVQYVQADATRLSGITEWLEVAHLAAAFGLDVIPHHGDHAQVQQHLVAATRNAPMIEYIPWVLDVFEEPAVSHGGANLVISDRPGAGSTISEHGFRKYRVR